jgi:hypothetical protein
VVKHTKECHVAEWCRERFSHKKGIEDVLHRSRRLFVCVFEDVCISSDFIGRASGLGTPHQKRSWWIFACYHVRRRPKTCQVWPLHAVS